MKKGKEKPILIDLDYFLLHVHSPEREISFTLDFSKKSSPFYLSVIALVISEMKKNNNMKKISLKENIEKIEFLDKKILEDTNYISKTQHGIFVKVTKAWQQRIKYLYKGGLFNLLFHVKDPFEDRDINKSPTYDENDFWEKLIKIWASYENASLKFAVDEVDLTLADVEIKFKGKKKDAWERYIESLKEKRGNETDEEHNRIDPKLQLKKEVSLFFKDLEKRFKYLRILHTQQKLTIDEQFEPIKVTPERMRWNDTENFWNHADSEKELERAYSFKGIERKSLKPISWNEAKKTSKRIMVLADPGMGKTTLLMMEAASIARQEREKLEKNEGTIDEAIFPILLRLSDFSDSEDAIFDDILKIIKRKYKRISRQIIGILEKKLETEKCIIFLDALDEVPIKNRNNLSDKLNNFIEDYPCQIICTSRIVGYPGYFLNNAKEFEILPFNQEQIRNYVKSWFESAADTIEDESVSAEGLLHELQNKPQIRGLAQTPLLLSLICSLYQEKDIELPTRRSIVFQKSLDYMLSKWGRKRNQQSEARIEAKLSLLENLAYHFLSNGKEIFPLRELLKFTKDDLGQGKTLTGFNNADSIITELSEDDGIFIKVEREGKRYIFFHRTFQEYLAASYLNQVFKKSQKKGIESVREYYWDFGWHETIALLSGLLSDPIPLIKDIISRQDDIFQHQLILAGRCIAEHKNNLEPIYDNVIKKLYIFWCRYPNEKFITSTLINIGKKDSRVVEMFLKGLRTKNDNVKRNSVYALGKIGSAECHHVLIEILNEEDEELRFLAARALGQIGRNESIPALINALDNKINYVSYEVADSLGRIGSSESFKSLINLLNGPDSGLKYLAAIALNKFETIESDKIFIQAIKDENDDIKYIAIDKLGRKISVENVAELIKMLRCENCDLRGHAAEALGRIGSFDSVQVLINAMRDEHFYVRKCAANALGEIGSADSVSALHTALNDEHRFVKIAAANALGKIGSYKSVPKLVKALKEGDEVLTVCAAEALAKIGNSDSISALIKALRDKDQNRRGAAAYTLWRIGNNECISALHTVLGDGKWIVREAAVSSLGKIGNLKSIPLIIKALSDESATVRESAANALGMIGSNEGVPALINAITDLNLSVRIFAAQALCEIGSNESISALFQAINYDTISYYNRCIDDSILASLKRIQNFYIFKKFIYFFKKNILNPEIFPLARTLAIKFHKEKGNFIPVFQEVIEKNI